MGDLFKAALSILCFGVFLVLNLTQPYIEVRGIAFLGGFLSGWACCYQLGVVVGEIKGEEQE